MAGNVIELTDSAFDEMIQGDTPVLVDFWAPWCGPCKMIAPIIEQIAEEYAGKVKVCKVNTDEHREAAVEYAISAIPTIILFKNGQIEKKWVGMQSKQELTDAIESVLQQ